jgi:hypothetical protein
MSHKAKLSICTNCNTALPNLENFCPNCGQENHDLKIPIGHLVYEAIESVFHFDNKFLNTSKALVLRPGMISKEFNEGKRAKFVPPFRLYIFLSFIFFFLLSLFAHPDEGLLINDENLIKVDKKDLEEGFIVKESHDSTKQGLSFGLPTEDPDKIEKMTDTQIDSLLKKEGSEVTKTNRFLTRKFAKLRKLTKEQLAHKFLKNTSILMFFLMPFFALILMLFYRKKKMYYFQHLIFSIYFHCFIFFFLSIMMFIAHFFNFGSFFIPVLLILTYLVIALRNFFQQGLGKTVLKGILLFGTYSIFLGIFILATLLASLIF